MHLTKSIEVKDEEGEVLPFADAREVIVKNIETQLSAEISEQAAPQFATGIPWGSSDD